MTAVARAVVLSLGCSFVLGAKWQGLTIAPEHRCSVFDRKSDYPYRQPVELDIIARMGGRIYGPYTGRCFGSRYDTDIEHIVAVSEAHDSGLCAATRTIKKQFASDLRNLTLAGPRINRYKKKHLDAGEWLPQKNKCWFANQIIVVKQAYGLTVDQAEAAALQTILAQCDSTDMVMYACGNNKH